MFRRRTGQAEPSGFDAGVDSAVIPAPDADPKQDGQQEQWGDTIAAIRQNSRRRSSDPAANSVSGTPRSGQLTPVRARVQQPHGSPHILQPLAPLQRQAANGLTQNPALSQGFSVFSNPLSSRVSAAGDPVALAAGARRPAALDKQPTVEHPTVEAAPELPQIEDAVHSTPAVAPQQHAAVDHVMQQSSTPTADTGKPAGIVTAAADAGTDAAPAATGSLLKHGSLASKALRFEVSAAGDHDSHDQELLDAQHMQSDDGAQQQYVYDEDTGQLIRVGEGADTTRLARHYLEDWNTGEFFQLAQNTSSCSCFAWLRRKPTTGPSSWGNATAEPSMLRSLAEFTDNMGSAMAALGMFAQGLGGGLALLSLFMTYLQYATAGIDGFLGYYSAHAQMVNRAFFTLISLSLVSAASRLAYDKLGSYKPAYLRLKLVDGLVLVLYLIAYLCNLIATPTDDQLTYEARRDLLYYTLPMQSAFLHKVTLWHVLNLIRIICCGLAWALVCYRSNPYVMMMVFEARKQQEAEEAAGGSVGNGTAAHTADTSRQQQQGFVTRFLAGEGANLTSAGVHQPQRFSDNQNSSLYRAGSGLAGLGGDGGVGYSTAGGLHYTSSPAKHGVGRMVGGGSVAGGGAVAAGIVRTSSLPMIN